MSYADPTPVNDRYLAEILAYQAIQVARRDGESDEQIRRHLTDWHDRDGFELDRAPVVGSGADQWVRVHHYRAKDWDKVLAKAFELARA